MFIREQKVCMIISNLQEIEYIPNKNKEQKIIEGIPLALCSDVVILYTAIQVYLLQQRLQ